MSNHRSNEMPSEAASQPSAREGRQFSAASQQGNPGTLHASRAQHRSTALTRMSAKVHSLLDPDRVLETIGAELKDQGLECCFGLLDHATGELVWAYTNLSLETLQAAQEIVGMPVEEIRVPADASTYLSTVLQHSETIFEQEVELRIGELVPAPMKGIASQLADLLQARQAIAAPLTAGSEALGILVVWSEHLTEEDVPTVAMLAQHAALAIERANLYQDEMRTVFEMEALRKTTLDMTQQLDLPQLLRGIVERAASLVGTKGGGLYLYHPELQELELVVSHNLGSDYTGTRLKVGEGLSGSVILSGEPLAVERYSNWHNSSAKFQSTPFGGVLAVPLKWGDKLIGVLNVTDGRSPRSFSDRDLWLIEWFANHAAVAIENARLFAESDYKISQLAALHEVSLEVIAETDSSAVLLTIVQKAAQLLEAEAGGIDLFDPQSQMLSMTTSYGYTTDLTGIRLQPGQGVAGKVCQTKQPLTVNDYADWPDRAPQVDKEEISSALGVPLLRGDELLGVLTIDRRDPHPFDEQDVQLATLFANQAAIAIENARLYEEQSKRSDELLALYETSLHVISRLEVDSLLTATIARAVQLLEGRSGDIYLYRPDTNDLISAASHQMPAQVQGAIIKPGEGLAGTILETKQPLIVDDYDSWSGQSARYSGFGFARVIGVPILFGDDLLGVVVVERGSEKRPFSEGEKDLLSLFAHQAAVAIENSRLFEEEKRRAEELGALYDVSTEIAAQLELPGLLDTIVERAIELLHARAGGLYLLDAAAGKLELTTGHGQTRDCTGIRLALGEGACGRVAQTGEPLIVNDYLHWEGRSRHYDSEPSCNVLAVPIKQGDTLLGAFFVDDSNLDRVFGDGDLRLATLLSNQAAIAIQNARTVAATKRRVTELAGLREVSLQLTQSLNLATVLETIVESAVRLVNAADAHIFLYHQDEDRFVFGSGAWAPGLEKMLFTEVRENGLTATVANRGEPVVINEARTHPLFRDDQDENKAVDAIAGFPLKRADQVLGVFNVAFLEPHTFDQDELRVLTLLADQAAMAIENARLYQQTGRRLKESQTLQEVSQLINSTLEPEQIYQTVVEKLASAFSYSMASIYIMRADELRLMAQVGYEPQSVLNSIPLSQGVIGRVARSGEAQYVRDVSADPDYLSAAEGVVSEIAVPIKRDGELLGVLNIESLDESRLTDADLPLLTSLAHQVSVATQNARLYQDAQREIADRKRAEEEYRSVVEHSLQGLAIIQDSLIVFANQAVVDMLGYTMEELLTLSSGQVRDLIHRDDQESVWGRLLDWESGSPEPSRYDCRLIRKDGGVIWVEVFVNATEYRGCPSIQAAVVDITERARAQEELQRSYLELRETLEGTVSALAALAEARDPYTAGHQVRVAGLACAIAEEMELSNDAIQAIRMAGLVHDIGKIQVPAEILSKPTTLTDIEMHMIRTHPSIAHGILCTVKFDSPVADIVLQHHECMDGSGYPNGLAAQDILVEARILAVADVVEAMASNRPYRPAHGIAEALAEIKQNANILYDAEVVRACCRLFDEKGFDLQSLG